LAGVGGGVGEGLILTTRLVKSPKASLGEARLSRQKASTGSSVASSWSCSAEGGVKRRSNGGKTA
jgi:hypothetical protein